MLQGLVHAIILGLIVGATYALIALGYTMVYGVLRLINFAHGEIYMAGAVTAWHVAGFAMQHEMPTWLRLVMVFGGAMVVCGMLGFVIEFLAYRPLRDRPRLVVLITAIGVSLLLQNLAQLKPIFGATPERLGRVVEGTFVRLVEPEPFYSFHIGNTRDPITISNLDALSLVLALVLMAVLTWIVMRTRAGLALRAVSYRVDTAALMGINTNRVIAFTFILGSALAAVAGVMDAIRYDIKPLMGLLPGLKAFIAAVVGGIGSIPGALLGGLILGLVENLAKHLLPPEYTMYADGIAFVMLILILLVRPSGILGKPLIEKV